VQREARVAPQVGPLARARHRAERQLPVLELGLDPADPRRPVGAQGGDRLVPVGVEHPAYPCGELRFRRLDLAPGGHAISMAGP
jgi:hypothetical protein